MKKGTRILIFILTVTFAVAFFCAFGACNENVAQAEYEVFASDGEKVVFKAVKVEGELSVYDAMTTLRKEGKLTFEGYVDDYGFTVFKVNGVQNAADWSSCWMVYTDLTKYKGVVYATSEYGSFTYENKTYASASYGVSSLPVVEGYTYILHYDVF